MKSFSDADVLSSISWAGFERLVLRYARAKDFSYSAIVGESGDAGADVLAVNSRHRWLFQAKAYKTAVGPTVVNETVDAARIYEADVPVIVSKSGFTAEVFQVQAKLAASSILLQLWDSSLLRQQVEALPETPPIQNLAKPIKFHDYQLNAIEGIWNEYNRNRHGSALVVLATGLGKTFVAAEALRRALPENGRVLVLAHTVDLVLQLERAFWPFLRKSQRSTVITGTDRPSILIDVDIFD